MNAPTSERASAHRVVRGVSAELAGTALLRGLSMLRLVVLARLFVPEEYGAYSTGLIIASFALLVVGGGIQPYVVKVAEERLGVAFWTAGVLSSTLGLAAAALMVAGGPLLARGLGDPQLVLVLTILSFSVLETAVTLPLTLLDRRFRFGVARVIEGGGVLVGLGMTVALHRAGMAPVYAMAAGFSGAVAVRGVALWLAGRPFPAFAFDRAEFMRQLRFSAPIILVSGFAFVEARADDMAVRVFWGNESLGLYAVAFYAPALLREVILAIDRVTLPIFAGLHAQSDLRDQFTRSTRLLALVSVPAGFSLAVFARPVLVFALGARWVGAAPLMSILGVAFGLKGCLGLNWGPLVYLSDSTRYLARTTAVNAVLMVAVGVPLVAWLGPVGGAWYALLDAVVFGPVQRFPLIRRVLGDLDFLRASVRPIALSGLLAAAAWALGGPHLDPAVGFGAFFVFVGAVVGLVLGTDRELRETLRASFGGLGEGTT